MDFKKKVIYQIVTDRFFDGDQSNNDCAQSRGLFDSTHTSWRLYWGGDLAGIRKKLAYLKGMGVGAIWISPPVDNINVGIPDNAGKLSAPYHGYEARDFMRIEEHFGDCANSWAAFDAMVAAAHRDGIKVIVDFAANHTSNRSAGEHGAIYDDGRFVASYEHDPNGYFHHSPNIRNWDDPYELQYDTLFDLADLNQDSPTIDAYLKSALQKFQQHGTDGFRLDAIRHVNWGWAYSLANAAHTFAPSFLFGEWFNAQERFGGPLYRDSAKFANHSGMSLLDYPLALAIRDVFSGKSGFSEIDDVLQAEDRDFRWPNDLVPFVDNHDLPRLLSIKDRRRQLDESLAFVLTCRGIPLVYYGDEQYLHNDTNGGNDPYNRVMMTLWDTTTRAYRLVRGLARLRASNDALAYGSFTKRRVTPDVYVFERRFSDHVVLVAINRNETREYKVHGLHTALPPGHYRDYLSGLLSGSEIAVNKGSGFDNPVGAFTLAPGGVAVWQVSGGATKPEVASVEPTVGQPGMQVTIDGEGFGQKAGHARFGKMAANIRTWSNTSLTFAVPNVSNGDYQIQLEDSGGHKANPIQFTVLTNKLIPVTFTVSNAHPTNRGDDIYLTGNTVELGKWGTTFSTAVGPMLDRNHSNWLLDVSLPACHTIRFKFIDILSSGKVIEENGVNHSYTVPCSGTGGINVKWQY